MRRLALPARARERRSRARGVSLRPTLAVGLGALLIAGCHLADRTPTTRQPPDTAANTPTTAGPASPPTPLPQPPRRLPPVDQEQRVLAAATDQARLVHYEQPLPEALPEPDGQTDDRQDTPRKLFDDPALPRANVWDDEPPSAQMVIEECRAAALQGNLDLNIVRVDPQITRQGVRAQNWKFEPFLSGTVTHNDVDPPPGNFSLGGPPPPRVIDEFQPAVNFPTPTGGTVSLVGAHNRLDLLPAGVFPGFPIFDAAAGLSVTQPLLRGGWFPTNLASIRVARLENASANAQVQLTSVIVLVTVETAYWRIYEAQRQAKVAEQQLDYARRQLQIARRLADEKIVAEIEVWRSESGLALRRNALIVALTELKLRSRELKQAMQRPDLPVDSPVEIEPITPPSPFDVQLDRAALEAYALSNRMELLQNGYALDINDQAIVVSRNGILPDVQLQLLSRMLGSGGSFAGADNQLRTGAFHDLFLGFTGEIPLAANQSGIARWRQAQLAKTRNLVVRRQLEVEIVKQVNDAVDRLEQNWQRVEAARKSVEAEQRTFQGEQRLFALGLRAADLVLDAATRLAIAQLQEVSATTDFMLARAELAFATGSMLGYSGVIWGDSPPRPRPLEEQVPGPPLPFP